MNFNPRKWFWSQHLTVIAFVVIYITLSLSPWYYGFGVMKDTYMEYSTERVEPYTYDEEGNPLNEQGQRIDDYGNLVDEQGELIPIERKRSLREEYMYRLNDRKSEQGTGNLSEFEKTYKDGGKLDSIDLVVIMSYAISLTYVLGLFLSDTWTSIKVNIPLVVSMIVKTLSILYYKELYKISLNNVITWWFCLIVYLIIFYVNDRVVVTETI